MQIFKINVSKLFTSLCYCFSQSHPHESSQPWISIRSTLWYNLSTSQYWELRGRSAQTLCEALRSPAALPPGLQNSTLPGNRLELQEGGGQAAAQHLVLSHCQLCVRCSNSSPSSSSLSTVARGQSSAAKEIETDFKGRAENPLLQRCSPTHLVVMLLALRLSMMGMSTTPASGTDAYGDGPWGTHKPCLEP